MLYECKASYELHEGSFRRGSIAAMELLNHLISSHRGKTHEQFFIQLRKDVREDQEVPQGLLHDLGAGGGALRNATAFLSEKFAVDLARLDQRADDQHQRVETRRIEAVREAFVPAKSGG